jgi:hypothetical protein
MLALETTRKIAAAIRDVPLRISHLLLDSINFPDRAASTAQTRVGARGAFPNWRPLG